MVKFDVSTFLDRDAVIRAVGKARARVLNEAGRLVRKRAQGSIKYADGPSRPGAPPHGHRSRNRTRVSKSTGKKRTRKVSLLREFLFYKYDPATKSVVIGPERLNTTVDPAALPALEYGGQARIRDRGKTRRVSVKARPFMGPAYRAEKPSIDALWKDSVR